MLKIDDFWNYYKENCKECLPYSTFTVEFIKWWHIIQMSKDTEHLAVILPNGNRVWLVEQEIINKIKQHKDGKTDNK